MERAGRDDRSCQFSAEVAGVGHRLARRPLPAGWLCQRPLQAVGPERGPLRIESLNGADAAAWDRFVHAAPGATFFHRAGWKQVIERSFGHPCHFLQVKRDDRITGVLPLVHLSSRLFGNALISTAYGVYGGPLASDEASLRRSIKPPWSSPDGWASTTWSIGCARRPTCPGRATPVSTPPSASAWRRTPRRSCTPCRANAGRCCARRRRSGSRARSTVTSDAFTGSIPAACAISARRSTRAAYFRTLLEVFGSDCEVLTVVRRGAPLSSVISFHFRDEVLPYYGGGLDEARRCAANDFMYWEVMRRACAKGAGVRFRPQQARHRHLRVQVDLGLRAAAVAPRVLPAAQSELPNVNPLNPEVRALGRAVAAPAAVPRQRARSADLPRPRVSRLAEILFLAHRIPYPPTKGDKIRAYHFLAHLARRHVVHLGCFVDDPDDWRHADHLRSLVRANATSPPCPERALAARRGALLRNEALSIAVLRRCGLAGWIGSWCSVGRSECVFAYSAAMAQFLPRGPRARRATHRRFRRCRRGEMGRDGCIPAAGRCPGCIDASGPAARVRSRCRGAMRSLPVRLADRSAGRSN